MTNFLKSQVKGHEAAIFGRKVSHYFLSNHTALTELLVGGRRAHETDISLIIMTNIEFQMTVSNTQGLGVLESLTLIQPEVEPPSGRNWRSVTSQDRRNCRKFAGETGHKFNGFTDILNGSCYIKSV